MSERNMPGAVWRPLLFTLLAVFILGCAASGPPLELVEEVELERYMGDWYVIAFIPLGPEKEATNAIESYELLDEETVGITYTFRKGSSEGPEKEYNAKAFVQEEGDGAHWKVQFIWPLRFDFLVIDLAEDYSYTVIGVPDRDHVWIMAREPKLDNATYDGILTRLAQQGYDTDNILKVPQEWGEQPGSDQAGS